MTREEVFETWAPPEAFCVWSTWVKPVLFSQLPASWDQQAGTLDLDPREWPQRLGRAAILVDLPGTASMQAGISLAQRGFRPVPLYNSVPDMPARQLQQDAFEAQRLGVAIDMWPVMRLLWLAASYMQSLQLPPDAPPAFLLDSRRREGERPVSPGVWDNRSMTFPTDFPSARVLLERDIVEAVVITDGTNAPATDLSHTLLRWQEAGIKVYLLRSALGEDITPIVVERPSMFGAVWYQFLRMFGWRRSLLGGFGGTVPHPSSG